MAGNSIGPYTALKIAGAAEGSKYSVSGGSADVRYKASFASASSGLSFGVNQLDVSVNQYARPAFKAILDNAVATGRISAATSTSFYNRAKKPNAGALFSQAEKAQINSLLSSRFRGQSLTVGWDFGSRLSFGGSLGRADWRYRRRMGSDRAAAAA